MDFERDFKGVWIPKEIWLNDELTMLEKCILVEIDSLDTEDGCNASNEYLAKFCQCTEKTITRTITKLMKMGLVYQKSFNGRVRVLKSCLGRVDKMSRQTRKNVYADPEKESQDKREKERTKEKEEKPIKEKDIKLINIDDYKENSIIDNRAKENSTSFLVCEKNEGFGDTPQEKKEKPTKERKEPPTIEEVYEYANTRGRGDLAKKFYDYYEATNWKDSKGQKVLSWKGKFITWENNNPKKEQKQEFNAFDYLKSIIEEN